MQKEPWSEKELKQVIEDGASICKNIHSLYPHLSWGMVSKLFGVVKHKAIKYFPDLKHSELLRSILENFSKEDLEDALNGCAENINTNSAKDEPARTQRVSGEIRTSK